MQIKLFNDFHKSEVNIRVKESNITDFEILISKRQMKRIRKELCGISDCLCTKISCSSLGSTMIFQTPENEDYYWVPSEFISENSGSYEDNLCFDNSHYDGEWLPYKSSSRF